MTIILISWAIVTIWWYYGIFCYFTNKEGATTKSFGIKILTTGENEKMVKETKELCERYCNKSPKIISRKKMKTTLSEVLPEDFQSKANFKGEQLEWSRKEHPMENTLYLDEDSEFYHDRIPVADIVQFQEIPQTENIMIAVIEASRIGFQIEQAAFAKTKPCYLWGGGFSVKKKIESNTTWNRASITEDTAFLYSIKKKFNYVFSKKEIYSQAPLTLIDLLKQRRRWTSGVFSDLKLIKNKKLKMIIIFRILNWAVLPLHIPFAIIMWDVNPLISVLFVSQTMIWAGVGGRIMGYNWADSFVIMLLSPIVSLFHCLGALWGLFYPVKSFRITPKESRKLLTQ